MPISRRVNHAIKHNFNLNTLLCIVITILIERGFRKFDNALDSIQDLREEMVEMRYRVTGIETTVGMIPAPWTHTNKYKIKD